MTTLRTFLLPLVLGGALLPAAAAQQPVPATALPQAGDGELDAVVAAVFRSPAFRQRFAESYLADTEIEPPVTDDDRDLLVEIGELLAVPAEQGGPKTDEAIGLLRGRVGPSASAVLDFTLANLLAQKERSGEAAAAYQRAVDKKPKFRRAWNNLGLLQVRSGDFRGAALSLARVLELGGGNAFTYGLLGVAHGNNDDHLAAESAYRMASLLDPLTVDWRLGLARSLFKQRRFAEAATLCGTLIGGNPDRADLWLLQANAFVGMNEPKKAIENLELVDKLGKATTDSLNLLGDVYVNEDLPDLAASAYERAMAKDQKGDPQRALRAAKALAARSAHAECERLLAAIGTHYAAKLDETAKKEILKLQARLAVARGSGEDEAKILEQVVALDPLDGEALLLLGQWCARSGKPEQAVLHYERAAGLPAFEADAKVRHAQLLVGQGKYAEAVPMLKRAQQLKPRDHVQQYLEQVERSVTGK
jgi:tetratricopeptide (TPR) repeat protein